MFHLGDHCPGKEKKAAKPGAEFFQSVLVLVAKVYRGTVPRTLAGKSVLMLPGAPWWKWMDNHGNPVHDPGFSSRPECAGMP
jgi:hypothetical protein